MSIDPYRITAMLPVSVAAISRWVYATIAEINYRYGIASRRHKIDAYQFKNYEPLNLRGEDVLLKSMLRQIDREVLYDVGMHKGLYTLPLAAQGCTVYGFEPNPTAIEQFQRSLALNEFEQSIYAYEIALSDENSTQDQWVTAPFTARSTFDRSMLDDNVRDVSVQTVRTYRLDDFRSLRSLKPPDAIKIDVEGHGLEVLKGASKTIDQFEPDIYYEPHPEAVSAEDIEHFFHERGYVIDRLQGTVEYLYCTIDEK